MEEKKKGSKYSKPFMQYSEFDSLYNEKQEKLPEITIRANPIGVSETPF